MDPLSLHAWHTKEIERRKKKNQISAYNTSSVDLNRSTYPTTLDAAILLCIYI